MPLSITDKLLSLMKEKNYSYADLEKLTSYSRSTLQRYFTGNTEKIPLDLIEEIAPIFGVTAAYLAGWEDDLPSYPGIMPVEKKRFPFLGEIACGEPIYADEEHNVYLESDSSIKADFCLRCKGDSMTGDNINDGDVVFIRKQDTVNNGDIACVIIDDEATLKHIYLADNTVSLVSSNLSYPPIVYKEDDCKTIKILGKAVALSRIL